jgi:hypothetical protein
MERLVAPDVRLAQTARRTATGRRTTGEVMMFATIRSLIPEPRQADQPRHYVGRHRVPETITARATVAVLPAADATQPEGELPAVG